MVCAAAMVLEVEESLKQTWGNVTKNKAPRMMF
jgi:hypothetical protein